MYCSNPSLKQSVDELKQTTDSLKERLACRSLASFWSSASSWIYWTYQCLLFAKQCCCGNIKLSTDMCVHAGPRLPQRHSQRLQLPHMMPRKHLHRRCCLISPKRSPLSSQLGESTVASDSQLLGVLKRQYQNPSGFRCGVHGLTRRCLSCRYPHACRRALAECLKG